MLGLKIINCTFLLRGFAVNVNSENIAIPFVTLTYFSPTMEVLIMSISLIIKLLYSIIYEILRGIIIVNTLSIGINNLDGYMTTVRLPASYSSDILFNNSK